MIGLTQRSCDNSVTTLENVNEEPNIYLIPEYQDDKALKRILPSAIECIWEAELMGWYTDESLWPKDKSAKKFYEWFEVETGSIVHDLLGDEIEKEEA